METLRILMVSTFYPPYHIGGDAIHVKYLTDELVRMGHEVHVIHSLDAYSLKKHNIHNVNDEVHIHRLKTSLSSASAAACYISGRNRNAERLVESVSDYIKSDVIHYHNISLLGYGVLRKGSGMKIYTAHDHWAICQRNDYMKYGMINCTNRTCVKCCIRSHRPMRLISDDKIISELKKMDAVISPSTYLQKTLRSYNLESILIKNFVPRVKQKTYKDGNYFSYVGVLEKHKGIDILIDAYSKTKCSSELHILGTGSYSDRIEKVNDNRIKQLGFLPREKVLSEVASSTCLIAPSRCCENSPLSCIEAMSVGVPLIVSSNGGLPEIAANCGVVISDESELITTLELFENDKEMRSRMSKNALKKYEKEHSPEAFMKIYTSLIEGTA